MNATNARSIGYEDGKRFIQGYMEEVSEPFFTDTRKVVVVTNAQNRVEYTYRVKSKRTCDFYVQGVVEAWEACEREWKQEQEEAARRASIPHNPASRFCTCQACRE